MSEAHGGFSEVPTHEVGNQHETKMKSDAKSTGSFRTEFLSALGPVQQFESKWQRLHACYNILLKPVIELNADSLHGDLYWNIICAIDTPVHPSTFFVLQRTG